jgi:hypothetical protein
MASRVVGHDPLLDAVSRLSVHDIRAIEDLDWQDIHGKIVDFRTTKNLLVF